MNIGIDARLINETGVGRYIRNLIRELARIDTVNTYVVFLRRGSYEHFSVPNVRWKKRLADVPWHSIAEQLVMPILFYRERLDLLHVPYFNVPMVYFGAFVVTIHDLTILGFDTGKASTLPYALYKIRRFGYRLALTKAMFWAKKIIAVSASTKREITRHFDIDPDDIIVTYEGVDAGIKASGLHAEKPYVLYVGNAYPHKNLLLLLRAFSRVPGDCQLLLVGKDDFFYRRLEYDPIVQSLGSRVIRKSNVSDSELGGLYKSARAAIFPSLMEGFALPALEALSFGCPLIVSDIPVFHELLDDAPKYIDPTDEKALASLIKTALTEPLRTEAFRKKAQAIVSRYSWKDMAKETLSIYEHSARVRSR